MKYFISSDIEGTNGIAAWSEADRKFGAEYAYFAAKMTEEVGAVCAGINEYDKAADILIKDAHASARNIDHAKLPANTRLNRGWPGRPCSMINMLDDSFDAVIFTGYHSPAYTDGNPLAHTINSDRINRITINGIVAGEFHINYFAALTIGVPVVMVTGDKMLCRLAKELDDSIITVDTLEGAGNSTTSEHPSVTLLRIKEASMKAAEMVESKKSEDVKWRILDKLPKSFDIEIRYRRQHEAYRASFFPGMSLTDDLTVGYKCENFVDFLKAWMFI